LRPQTSSLRATTARVGPNLALIAARGISPGTRGVPRAAFLIQPACRLQVLALPAVRVLEAHEALGFDDASDSRPTDRAGVVKRGRGRLCVAQVAKDALRGAADVLGCDGAVVAYCSAQRAGDRALEPLPVVTLGGHLRHCNPGGVVEPGRLELPNLGVVEWDFDPNGGVQGFWQQGPPDWARRYHPVEKTLLFKPRSEKGNPVGRSVLRNAYFAWYFSKKIAEIEGIGIARDLAGVPVGWIPAACFDSEPSPNDRATYAAMRRS